MLWARGLVVLGLALTVSRFPVFFDAVAMNDFDYAATQMMMAFGGVLMMAAPLAKRGWSAVVIVLVGGGACIAALASERAQDHGTDLATTMWLLSVATIAVAALAIWRANHVEVPAEPLTGTLDNPLGFTPPRRHSEPEAKPDEPTRSRRRYQPKI